MRKFNLLLELGLEVGGRLGLILVFFHAVKGLVFGLEMAVLVPFLDLCVV